MGSLRAIISAFLDDLTLAQNNANKRSARLSRRYRNDPILRFFPVPNAELDEADVTLRFSIEAMEADPPGTQEKIVGEAMALPRVVAADIAAAIATLVLAALRSRIGADESRDHETVLALRRQLWTQTVRRALTQSLAACLQPLLKLAAIEPSRPTLDAEIRNALVEALELTFGADEDLAGAVGPARDWALEIAQGAVGSHAAAALADAAQDASAAGSLHPSTSFRVDLAPHRSDVPETLVQSVRLRAKLRNYTWVIVEDGEPEHDQLVPES